MLCTNELNIPLRLGLEGQRYVLGHVSITISAEIVIWNEAYSSLGVMSIKAYMV